MSTSPPYEADRPPPRRTLPQILPAVAEEASSPVSSSDSAHRPSATPTPVVSVHPRATVTRVACDGCRRRRTKCSGERPSCAACLNYQSECHYASSSPSETNSQALKRKVDELQADRDGLVDVYKKLLTQMPLDVRAFSSLQRLRSAADLPASDLEVSDLQAALQDEEDRRARGQIFSKPEAPLFYKFPYRAAMPFAIERSNSLYLESDLFQISRKVESLAASSSEAALADDERIRQLQLLATQHSPALLNPYHAAQHIDGRLALVEVGRWTAVITDSKLFASLITSYLVHEYPVYPVFQKDIFLDAVAHGDGRFCSPLLVNALLAEACHCLVTVPDRERYWDPRGLSYCFLAEAKRLWELEMDFGRNSLATAEAAFLLQIVHAHNGMDKLGHRYLLRGLSMAHEIGIFGSFPLSSYNMDMTSERAMVFAAWCFYRTASIYSYHFRKPPLVPDVPQTPLPDPEDNPTWYGDCYLLYPMTSSPFSTYHGKMFERWSELRIIINHVGHESFGASPTGTLLPRQYLALHDRLEAWFNSLPAALTAIKVVWPSQLQMHMEYFAVLITMSYMLGGGDIAATPPWERHLTKQAREKAAQTLCDAVTNLETLIRLYYMRHSFQCFDPYMTHMLAFMVHVVMSSQGAGGGPMSFDDADAKEHARSTLALCLLGLADQGKHIYLAKVLCKFLLSHQPPEFAATVGPYMPEALFTDDDDEAVGREVRSAYPLFTAPGGRPQDDDDK